MKTIKKVNKIALILAFATIYSASAYSQTPAQLAVFGYKFGEKIAIPECKCGVTNYKAVGQVVNSKYATYVRDSLITADCFERNDLSRYKIKDIEKGLPPVDNGTFFVALSQSNLPKAGNIEGFKVTVFNSILIKARYIFDAGAANDVLEALKEKYGNDVVIKSYKWQNGLGGSIDYYQAVWSFPYLTVTFLSTMTSLPSKGSVDIVAHAKVNEPKRDRSF